MDRNIVYLTAALLCIILCFGCGSPEPSLDEPDIYLLVIDSFRSDHMSGGGYSRDCTPVMDSLASRGSVWRETQAQSSWNMPGMASILTGLPQRVHRAGFDQGLLYGLDPLLPTLPMLLQRRAGYQTAGFFSSPFLSEAFGFHHEFDHFDCEQPETGGRMRIAAETIDTFLDWFDTERIPGRPLVAVIHFSDPRLPYSPPAPFDTEFTDPGYEGAFGSHWGSFSDITSLQSIDGTLDPHDLSNLEALYDGEISYVDSQIGRLIRELTERGGLGNTVFVITGTSGEELGDHGGIGNGHTLYQEVLLVPLIISGSGIAAEGDRSMVAAQIDILPTVLNICGVDQPLWSKGEVLLGHSSTPVTREIASSNLFGDVPQMGSVRLGSMIVIGDPVEYSFLQFDLGSDPLQTGLMQPTSDYVDKLLVYWSSPVNGHPQPVYSRTNLLEHRRGTGEFTGSNAELCVNWIHRVFCQESERNR